MQDALRAQSQDSPIEVQPAADAEQPNLFLRHDTIFGVCQGLGEDFGFNPTYLRLAFVALLYFSPLWVVGTYVALGLAVALSRWLAPVQRSAAGPCLAANSDTPEAVEVAAAPSERLAA